MLTPQEVNRIYELRKQGMNVSQIARALKISRPTVLKYLYYMRRNTMLVERKSELEKPIQEWTQAKGATPINRREPLIKLAQIEEQGRQRLITEREEWIQSKAEEAVNYLKYITPYQFENLLNVRHFLTLKEEVRKILTPLYGKESDWTIKDLLKQITKEYYDDHIKPSADKILQERELKRREEERVRNRELLINRGTYRVYWKTVNDDIDWSERRELEAFVREGLEEEITGEETDQALESLVETLIDEWFEED